MLENNVTNVLANVNNFDFNAEHNGVQCIASCVVSDYGTSRQYWFTTKMLCEIFNVSDKTLRNNIESLINDEELVDCNKLQSTIYLIDSLGRKHITTIYNLDVLNKLGMCCFRGNKRKRSS